MQAGRADHQNGTSSCAAYTPHINCLIAFDMNQTTVQWNHRERSAFLSSPPPLFFAFFLFSLNLPKLAASSFAPAMSLCIWPGLVSNALSLFIACFFFLWAGDHEFSDATHQMKNSQLFHTLGNIRETIEIISLISLQTITINRTVFGILIRYLDMHSPRYWPNNFIITIQWNNNPGAAKNKRATWK